MRAARVALKQPAAGGATYDSTVLADSPVAYLLLNEPSGTSAADATGNSHTGTYTGGFTLNQTGPCSDGEAAVLLDGSSGYVTIPDTAALRLTGDLSLEAWVKPTDHSGYFGIVTKCLGNGGSTSPFEWRLNATFGQPDFTAQPSGDVTGSSAAANGAWSHLVVTRSGTTVQHYLNGSTNGSSGSVSAGPYTDSGRPVLIGNRDDNGTLFKGAIAKVALYSTVLSSGRVAAHYAAR